MRRAYNAMLFGGKGRAPSKTGYTVYGASWCGYCKKAKELLRRKKKRFQFYDYEKVEVPGRIRKLLNREGFPQVYYKGKHVGGFTELKALLQG